MSQQGNVRKDLLKDLSLCLMILERVQEAGFYCRFHAVRKQK